MTDTRPLSDLCIDPTTRPKAPALPDVTDIQRQNGKHLAAIHRMHLMEMARVRRVLDAIEAGKEDPSTLPNLVATLDMTQNFRTFGNMCGRECQMLSMHHNIEEQRMFPELEAKANDGIRAVVARLREEHKIVHALIERLYSAAVNLVNDPGDAGFAECRDTFNALEDVVRSHFGYEETELADALGVYLDAI